MATRIKIGVFIANDNGDLLMIKEKVKKNDRPLWNIIKGSYGDSGNETIFEAAERECAEEASVKVELTATTGCYVTGQPDDYGIQFNFIAKIISGEPKLAIATKQSSRDEAISEVKWFSKDELSQLSKDEFISSKIYGMAQDWLKGDKFPLTTFKQ